MPRPPRAPPEEACGGDRGGGSPRSSLEPTDPLLGGEGAVHLPAADITPIPAAIPDQAPIPPHPISPPSHPIKPDQAPIPLRPHLDITPSPPHPDPRSNPGSNPHPDLTLILPRSPSKPPIRTSLPDAPPHPWSPYHPWPRPHHQALPGFLLRLSPEKEPWDPGLALPIEGWVERGHGLLVGVWQCGEAAEAAAGVMVGRLAPGDSQPSHSWSWCVGGLVEGMWGGRPGVPQPWDCSRSIRAPRTPPQVLL